MKIITGQENNQTITLEDLEEYVIGAALHPAQVSLTYYVDTFPILMQNRRGKLLISNMRASNLKKFNFELILNLIGGG